MVELALDENDAADWVYRGEGGANLVLAYTGSSPNFIGKVLRVQKAIKNEQDPLVLSMHECLVWRETGNLLSAPTRDIAKHLYVQHVMCPILGSQHVDAGVRVVVTKEFLESVRESVLFQRPSWRVDNSGVNTLHAFAILMPDHSVFPHGVDEEELCISVEIKPKCGFLPISRFIREENEAKKRISRFKLHQILKLHQKKISQISKYDPLDMFSGSKQRVEKSIEDLFLTPQNNFRIFLNGSLVSEAFEDTLKGVIKADNGLCTPTFLKLVSKAVFDSRVLDRLVQVQKLDVYDIEGAIHAYFDVISKPCVVCGELGELASRYESLHSLPLDQSLKIVRDFLISATAKDLSLMISFRLRREGNAKSLYDNVFLESVNQSFDYKVSFIDLDLKPLERMPYYYKLDQEIMGCYRRTTETVNGD